MPFTLHASIFLSLLLLRFLRYLLFKFFLFRPVPSPSTGIKKARSDWNGPSRFDDVKLLGSDKLLATPPQTKNPGQRTEQQ